MKDNRLDSEILRLHGKLPFLWNDYDFHLKYFTRDYGMYYRGFIIGLENDIFKVVFEKESDSQVEPITVYVGAKHAPFAPPHSSYFVKDGWYPLTGLGYWLSGAQCERDKDVDRDLENVSQYLELHMEKLLDLFKYPEEFERKLEQHKNLYKDKQISVEKIREERARLHALGQDSSLEAAIVSLRGGGK